MLCEGPQRDMQVGKADREEDSLPERLWSGSEHRSPAGCVSAEILLGPEYLNSECELSWCEWELGHFQFQIWKCPILDELGLMGAFLEKGCFRGDNCLKKHWRVSAST